MRYERAMIVTCMVTIIGCGLAGITGMLGFERTGGVSMAALFSTGMAAILWLGYKTVRA